MWRPIDRRKSKKKQKLIQRTQSKLEQATSRQVDQILTFNLLLDTLSKHDQTMTRFQANSSTLHRCLIKWDKLKAHDQSFTRTSIRLALELQRFMNQMDDYFRIPQDHPPPPPPPHPHPHHHLQHQHHEQQVIVVEGTTNITTTTTTADTIEEEPSTQITPSPISLNEAFVEIITAGPSAHLRIEEDPSTHQPNYTTTVSTTRTTVPLPTTSSINPRDPDDHHLPPPPLPPTTPQDPQPSNSTTTATTNPSSTYTTKLGLRKQIVLKYRLNQLRFKTKKFNQKFQLHETKKFELKFNGNQCIINMVDDGKALLEINEAIVQLVFHLSLLRKPKSA
ncbi:uncharacterized protein PGTG_02888 [Puccinia graminis f. sp. tritici CRL 75-36-700-3]|uniref:Uncharacterized protein n=1 Tax=Puccinia graminis f. sp. tritici (strain CRL 75-36-700-3 / race SCCL) TaxID=418459 RepID=E3JWM2_PUCGT|nr:uncharacterized protein PGTG_02888 [Puccinia graminis f. sp. tritici CRL 75-36-700-3]EFP76447.2 hypothetical protein PGTG_02888 [Puccinia graminis f. sp. tritici CRL 75-36-700-3]